VKTSPNPYTGGRPRGINIKKSIRRAFAARIVDPHADGAHPKAPPRIASIDNLRGIAMLLMALDHVRDFVSLVPYDPTDLSQASAGLFLTRWITHFCAPTFVFLAGTSAFLYGKNRTATTRDLRHFLLGRGLLLVLFELSWVNLSWRFDFNGLRLQVVWVLGCSMTALALLLNLPPQVLVGIGLAMVFAHNLADGIGYRDLGGWGWVWAVLHQPRFEITANGFELQVLYPLVPWIGVMLLGYAFGRVYDWDAAPRERFMRRTGLVALALFFTLRLSGLYGDPNPWTPNPRGALYSVFAVFNLEKYPPSLDYLLMTLGAVLLLLPALEPWRGRVAQAVAVFGRVPLFFYLLHLPVVPFTTAIGARVVHLISFAGHGEEQSRADYGPSLLRVYVVWLILVLAMYPLCRWYDDYKRRHVDRLWLAYL